MSWAHPQAFWLLLLLPLAFWPLRRMVRGCARFATPRGGSMLTGKLGLWGPHMLAGLRAAGLALLIAALARPQTIDAQSHRHTEGIAIQLVLDTSNSMGYTDYALGDELISRMDAARHAIRLFVKGDGNRDLQGRPHDLIGLVTFNRYPDVACPLTHSHDTLLAALEEVVLGPYTNIGDGLAWGLDRLRRAEPKQKVLILLSDGKQNIKEAMRPEEVAELAVQLGVRIYTVGAVGNQAEVARLRAKQPTRARLPTYDPADSVDEGAMRRIAERTGGRYYRATDTEGLTAIYQDIDQLEKSKIERTESVQFDEWYLYLLIPSLLALGLEQLLAATRFLVVP
jgi:Ca-activated chloride channel family protein